MEITSLNLSSERRDTEIIIHDLCLKVVCYAPCCYGGGVKLRDGVHFINNELVHTDRDLLNSAEVMSCLEEECGQDWRSEAEDALYQQIMRGAPLCMACTDSYEPHVYTLADGTLSLTPKNDGVFIEDYNDLDADDDSDYDLYADDDFAKYNEDFDDAMIEADSRELAAEEATFKNDSTVELHYPTTTINTEEEEDCHLKEFKDSSLPPKCRVVYRKINGNLEVSYKSSSGYLFKCKSQLMKFEAKIKDMNDSQKNEGSSKLAQRLYPVDNNNEEQLEKVVEPSEIQEMLVNRSNVSSATKTIPSVFSTSLSIATTQSGSRNSSPSVSRVSTPKSSKSSPLLSAASTSLLGSKVSTPRRPDNSSARASKVSTAQAVSTPGVSKVSTPSGSNDSTPKASTVAVNSVQSPTVSKKTPKQRTPKLDKKLPTKDKSSGVSEKIVPLNSLDKMKAGEKRTSSPGRNNIEQEATKTLLPLPKNLLVVPGPSSDSPKISSTETKFEKAYQKVIQGLSVGKDPPTSADSKSKDVTKLVKAKKNMVGSEVKLKKPSSAPGSSSTPGPSSAPGSSSSTETSPTEPLDKTLQTAHCQVCKVDIPIDDVDKHIQESHSQGVNNKPGYCQLCPDKTIMTAHFLRKHRKDHHADVKNFRKKALLALKKDLDNSAVASDVADLDKTQPLPENDEDELIDEVDTSAEDIDKIGNFLSSTAPLPDHEHETVADIKALNNTINDPVNNKKKGRALGSKTKIKSLSGGSGKPTPKKRKSPRRVFTRVKRKTVSPKMKPVPDNDPGHPTSSLNARRKLEHVHSEGELCGDCSMTPRTPLTERREYSLARDNYIKEVGKKKGGNVKDEKIITISSKKKTVKK